MELVDLLSDSRVAETQELIGTSATEMLRRVITDAARVLMEVGLGCADPALRQLIEGTELAGFDETTGRLHVLPELVVRAVEATPKNDAFWLPMQSFGFGGTAPFVADDRSGEHVEPDLDAIRRLARAAEESDVVAFIGRGVKLHRRNAEAIQLLAAGTDKTIYAGVESEEELCLVEGLHTERGKMLVIWDIVHSPLRLADAMAPLFSDCARRGVPMILASMPMPAVTAPYSMSGLLTVALAEFFAGLVLVQTIRPGTQVVCGAFPTAIDVNRSYALDFGSVAHNAANMLISHAARMLDIPACQSGCTTSEKGPSDRAVADARLGYGIFKRYGCHMIRHAFGFTKDLLAFSFPKMERTIAAFKETGADHAPELRLPTFDEGAFDAIARNAAGGSFMHDEHTLAMIGREFVGIGNSSRVSPSGVR